MDIISQRFDYNYKSSENHLHPTGHDFSQTALNWMLVSVHPSNIIQICLTPGPIFDEFSKSG